MALFAVIGLCAGMCAAEVVMYRDASGRVQRTSTTDRNGRTTHRDGQGRLIGTETIRR